MQSPEVPEEHQYDGRSDPEVTQAMIHARDIREDEMRERADVHLPERQVRARRHVERRALPGDEPPEAGGGNHGPVVGAQQR